MRCKVVSTARWPCFPCSAARGYPLLSSRSSDEMSPLHAISLLFLLIFLGWFSIRHPLIAWWIFSNSIRIGSSRLEGSGWGGGGGSFRRRGCIRGWRKLFSHEDKQALAQAILEAERATSAENVAVCRSRQRRLPELCAILWPDAGQCDGHRLMGDANGHCFSLAARPPVCRHDVIFPDSRFCGICVCGWCPNVSAIIVAAHRAYEEYLTVSRTCGGGDAYRVALCLRRRAYCTPYPHQPLSARENA